MFAIKFLLQVVQSTAQLLQLGVDTLVPLLDLGVLEDQTVVFGLKQTKRVSQ